MKVTCSLIAVMTLLVTAVFGFLLMQGIRSNAVVGGYVLVVLGLQIVMDVLRARARIRERIGAPTR